MVTSVLPHYELSLLLRVASTGIRIELSPSEIGYLIKCATSKVNNDPAQADTVHISHVLNRINVLTLCVTPSSPSFPNRMSWWSLTVLSNPGCSSPSPFRMTRISSSFSLFLREISYASCDIALLIGCCLVFHFSQGLEENWLWPISPDGYAA